MRPMGPMVLHDVITKAEVSGFAVWVAVDAVLIVAATTGSHRCCCGPKP